MEFKKMLKEAGERCRELYGKELGEIYSEIPISLDNIEEIHESLGRMLEAKRKSEEIIKIRPVKPFIPSASMDDFLHGPLLNSQNKDGKILIDYWREKWNNAIINQDVPCDLYCLAFLSQIFRDVTIYRGTTREDLRLHICLIMPSGTGKSEGTNILCELAEKVGLNYTIIVRYTGAILAGSIDSKAIDSNIKKKLVPGMEGYLDPKKPSVLEKFNFACFDEGEAILKSTTTTEDAQRILQQAMNRHGSAANTISNDLVGGTITSNPNSSVIITSYYLQEFKETLLNRGLLQRMIVYIQEESNARRIDITNKIIDEIPSYTNDISEAYAKQEELEARNERINQSIINEVARLREYHKDTKTIVVNEAVKDIIRESVESLRNNMPYLTYQNDIWQSMISRLTVNVVKISAIFALMNYRTSIEEWDARAATNLLMKTMETVGFFLKKNITKDISKKVTYYYGQLHASKYYAMVHTTKDWEKIFEMQFNTSSEQAKLIFRLLVEHRKLTPLPGPETKDVMFKFK